MCFNGQPRAAHPREDHLLPLMVAVGAAGGYAGTRVYHQSDFMGAITASSYRFGEAVIRSRPTLPQPESPPPTCDRSPISRIDTALTDKPRIALVIGSARPTRFANKPAQWMLKQAQARDDMQVELGDLRDRSLPFFAEMASNLHR